MTPNPKQGIAVVEIETLPCFLPLFVDTYSTDTWITDGSLFKKLASPPNQQYAILGGDATYK